MRSPRPVAFVATVVSLGAALALLHACQDPPEPGEPRGAPAAVQKTLTVKGAGSGDGTVTSSPAGVNCAITKGAAGTTGCAVKFARGTAVTLTPAPKAGHSFKTWSGSCSGGGPCTVSMSVNRSVTARFLKGPFTITVSGGGTGSGTVASQPGLTPAIDCAITNGTAGSTGCSARYPANTVLTLTATPGPGAGFGGWGAPCSGTGQCTHAVTYARTISATFGASGPVGAALRGQWGSTFPTPVVAVHLHLLPTGKVLLWGHRGESEIWDPANPGAGFTRVTKTYDFFCSGHTFLGDGRLLVTGGTIGGTHGDPRAVLMSPGADSWAATASMAQGRYYPTLTTLPNGDVLAVSGSDESNAVVALPEIWNGSTWRKLSEAPLLIPAPYYPAMFVAPDGRVFLAGFQQTTRYLDVSGDGAWTVVGDRNGGEAKMGSAAMFAPGKVLWVGGGDPPTNAAEVIDLNEAAPAWRTVAGMAYARRQHNATMLADGQVLVTHGTSGAGFNNMAAAVRAAELWNPATESWSTMAEESKSRGYHSSAILLPDGRVLSSGSGEGGGVSYDNSEFTAQVFSPPYLFNPDGSAAARPEITAAPSHIAYGAAFTVETPEAGTVSRGTLVRLSSVTHAFNQSQHLYPLSFTAAGNATLQAVGPPNAALAPPGPYLLFLVNGNGVPSTAAMVTVGP